MKAGRALGAAAVAVLGVGSAWIVAVTRAPPSAEVIVGLAAEARTRQAGEEGIQAISDARVENEDLTVVVLEQCTPFTFAWFANDRWYVRVETTPEGGESEVFWMEIARFTSGPALIQARASGPPPGCVGR
ncbi:hypothetical protein LBMAG42_45980 [Deltaproteobacteria bacterium]|nr:hypothetical protein LBMAG42_45980 [Deltaproteobacteria bacterium]